MKWVVHTVAASDIVSPIVQSWKRSRTRLRWALVARTTSHLPTTSRLFAPLQTPHCVFVCVLSMMGMKSFYFLSFCFFSLPSSLLQILARGLSFAHDKATWWPVCLDHGSHFLPWGQLMLSVLRRCQNGQNGPNAAHQLWWRPVLNHWLES